MEVLVGWSDVVGRFEMLGSFVGGDDVDGVKVLVGWSDGCVVAVGDAVGFFVVGPSEVGFCVGELLVGSETLMNISALPHVDPSHAS